VRLLFDQNLSQRLVEDLGSLYPDSAHVRALGLATATDRDIWTYAAEKGYIIVSKDSDFRQLAFLLGPPPKAVWLRVGNGSTMAIAELLRTAGDVIARFTSSEEEALLVLPNLDG
jgi:predicted nuclease of predicted toxin-antitoxin system